VIPVLLASSSCNKRQILPGTIAGVGMGVSVGGFIHSATRPEGSGFWGESTGDAAAIGSMIFGGAALAICGILFAVTAVDCETDDDCWSGDVCLVDSQTCVSAESVARIGPEPPGAPAVAGVDAPASPSDLPSPGEPDLPAVAPPQDVVPEPPPDASVESP
jgi:hypothetical protein